MTKKPERFSLTGDRARDAEIANLVMDDMGIPRLCDPERTVVMSPERRAGFNLLMAVLLPTHEELEESRAEAEARRTAREPE